MSFIVVYDGRQLDDRSGSHIRLGLGRQTECPLLVQSGHSAVGVLVGIIGPQA